MIDALDRRAVRGRGNPNAVQSRTMAVQGRIGECAELKLDVVQVQHGFQPRMSGTGSLGVLYVSRLAAGDRRPWMRLLDEYLSLRYRRYERFFDVRIGEPLNLTTLAEEMDRRFAAQARPTADAVVITPKRVLVFTAAITARAAHVLRLSNLLRLAPKTPELTPYLDRAFSGILVCARRKRGVLDDADEERIEVREHLPRFMRAPDDPWSSRVARRKREVLAERRPKRPRSAQSRLTR